MRCCSEGTPLLLPQSHRALYVSVCILSTDGHIPRARAMSDLFLFPNIQSKTLIVLSEYLFTQKLIDWGRDRTETTLITSGT